MIEFRKGERWCRWNGILMSPSNHKKLFGCEEEIWVEDDYIVDGDTIYTDKPIGKILAKIGEYFPKVAPYDSCVDNGYGWKDHCWEERLADHYLFPASFIKHLKVKTMTQFTTDYPRFNQTDHDAFYDELNEYYEKLRQ